MSRTSFSVVYDSFLARITNDLYMELTELDTLRMLEELLLNAISRFEYPRFDIYDYELGSYDCIDDWSGLVEEENSFTYAENVPLTLYVSGFFNNQLTEEEINILSLNMVIEWLGQQLATTENTRMKMSSSDFKTASQANHMAKIQSVLSFYQEDCSHLQKVYRRRKGGRFLMSDIMKTDEN